jgi:signal transduction histidine kinase
MREAMPQDGLGLFDTPPTRGQIRFGATLIAINLAAVLIMFQLPNVRLVEVDAVVPIVDSLMLLCDLVVAGLIYVQAAAFRSRALTVLASSFVLMTLLLVTHMLTFPGAFAPNGLLGAGLGTTGWIMLVRRAVFPAAVIGYVFLRRREESARPEARRPDPRLLLGMALAFALAVGISLLVTMGHDLLPPLFVDRIHAIRSALNAANIVLTILTLAAVALLLLPRRSMLDMWLGVSLITWVIQLVLHTHDWGRFTTGFYLQYAMLPISHFILMLVLLGESGRLYARLMLSTAARNRDRDARLVSLDAMAAAFAHEIGQPLTAATANALAGINSLSRAQPNIDEAIDTLNGVIDAAKRTASVTNNLRAMIGGKSGPPTLFSVNDLVRQTAASLEGELRARKISLQLRLSGAVPPVYADRAQIRQVLVNLLVNAIESVAETQDQPRRVIVRSTSLDGRGARVEVSDSGPGISPGQLDRIFEPFVTTKPAGTGLGLPICRTIIEEHGGRLWVALGEGDGATFTLELPCNGFAA